MDNFTRATSVTNEVEESIVDAFQYPEWDAAKIEKGTKVRNVLMDALRVIVENVPPSADRSVAIRKLREARMDCNSAITHGGKY